MTQESTQQQAPPAEPPPAFAARYGLVRPTQQRYLAGVCGALGRATRTDPVLWRVLLPVFSCFGGVGALLYVAVWMLTPSDGDTGSPVEAMVGRGHSRTSPVLVVVLGVLSAGLAVLLFSDTMHVLLLAGIGLLAVLLVRERARSGGPAASAGPGHSPQPAAEATADPGPPESEGRPLGKPAPTTGDGGVIGDDQATAPAASATTGGYRLPFAPHGPFAPQGQASPAGRPGPPGHFGPSPQPHSPPRPPARRERSPLTAFTLLTALLVLGAIGTLELAGVTDIPIAGYVAAALATVGGGLVVGAWLGRGRSLIALGLVLGLVGLPTAYAIDRFDPPQNFATSIHWAPTTVAEVQEHYELMAGEGTLDLRGVTFPPGETQITVQVAAGDVRVYVPPEVNVEAQVEVRAGQAVFFGRRAEGPNTNFESMGTEGPDGATLHLHMIVHFGHMEVNR